MPEMWHALWGPVDDLIVALHLLLGWLEQKRRRIKDQGVSLPRSSPVEVKTPHGLKVSLLNPTNILIHGIDKQQVWDEV